jgi:hypothetical protein
MPYINVIIFKIFSRYVTAGGSTGVQSPDIMTEGIGFIRG